MWAARLDQLNPRLLQRCMQSSSALSSVSADGPADASMLFDASSSVLSAPSPSGPVDSTTSTSSDSRSKRAKRGESAKSRRDRRKRQSANRDERLGRAIVRVAELSSTLSETSCQLSSVTAERDAARASAKKHRANYHIAKEQGEKDRFSAVRNRLLANDLKKQLEGSSRSSACRSVSPSPPPAPLSPRSLVPTPHPAFASRLP